jgi:carbonic anhydrase
VTATVEQLLGRSTNESWNLRSIVDRMRPSIEPLLEVHGLDDPAALMSAAGRANVHASVEQLRHGSALLEQLIQEDGLLIVGAEYSLESGVVTFFDGVDGLP